MPPKKMRLSKGALTKKGAKAKEGEAASPPQGGDSSSEESDTEEQEGGTRIAGVYIPPAPPAVCSVESVGPRLIITHIVNLNFKSYAGRQVLGPFHKSFTCVIGPNGSGKSNVIDSMLFVFGYRATKIRSKKISVLLHKSENHRDIKHATVEVHFAKIIDIDDEKFEVVPNSEFYVSRTANYDNSSHYTINGKRAQFKDVSTLLGSHGIDLKHNRFLILQGEVEQIAMMKPKGPTEHESGMLEYLEDIIGTSRYKQPIEKLDAKVNELTEERQEKLNRVKLAEKDKEALQNPMEEAVEFLKKTNEHTLVKNKMFQIQSHKITTKLNKLKEDKEKMDQEIALKKEKLKEAQDKIAEKEKAASGIKKEYEGLKLKKEKLTDSFNKVEKRATQLKEEITQTNKKRKKAMESKAQEEKKLSDLEKIPEKNTKEINELNVLQEKLKKEQEVEEQEVQKVLESLKIETKGFQDQKDQFENTLIGLNRDRDNAKSKYELAKTELTVYLSNEKKEKEKLAKLKSTLENITRNLEEKQKVLEELSEAVPQKELTLTEKQKELAELKIEETRVMGELNHQRAVMEEKKHSMSASASRNRVIDFLMKEKEKGAIPGIFGRLGDLGGIDGKYDCAVSTACGPLDYVVVDTSSTAKACINALKRSNVGRGNFIALDQQNKFIPNCKQRFNGPENVPRLFDLIKVEDERVKPAFYFGLRDTLVADDLAQARRVAYGATRFRVVTLNGEIIEIAGTMSGGGRDKRTGRMGRSATVKTDVGSPGAMRKLEERVSQLQERASSIHQKMNQLEPEILNLNKDLRKLKMDLTSAQMEVKNLSQQVPSIANQVTSQEAVVARTVSDPQVVQEKTDVVNALKDDFDKASAESGEIEKKVAELTEKITAITGGRMKAAQQKLDKVSKQLDKVSAEITKLTVAIKTSERNCKKSRDRIQALTNEITEAEESLKKAQEENKSLEDEAVKVNQFIEDVANKLIELETSMSSDKGETSNLNKEVNALKAELMNSNQESTELGKKVSELEDILGDIQRKISSLKLEVIPDDEEAPEGSGVYKLPVFSEEELNNFDRKKIEYECTRINEQLANMSPNLKAIDEYKEKVKILKERMADYKDVQDRRNETRKGLDDVRKARLNEFMVGFNIISNKLKEMYQMITFGGDAEFELVDTLDPFTEGISFSVRPPKKSWKNITNLSGGEKTLSSLALVFALHYYKPSPLFFMDEIDAALDFKNVSIVGHYIKERTKNAQFIIISLRSNMFELADVLVGIYKTYNCTKSITVTPALYVKTDENGVERQYRTVVVTHSDQPLGKKSPPRKVPHSTKLLKRDHSSDSSSPPRKVACTKEASKSPPRASLSSPGGSSLSSLSPPGNSSQSREGSVSPPEKQQLKDSNKSPPRKRAK